MADFLSDERKAEIKKHQTHETNSFGDRATVTCYGRDVLSLLYELEVTKRAYSLAVDDLGGFYNTIDRAIRAKGLYMEQAQRQIDQERQP